MDELRYKADKPGKPDLRVYLGRRRIGTIKHVPGGHSYFPLGAKKSCEAGPVFETIAQVKADIGPQTGD